MRTRQRTIAAAGLSGALAVALAGCGGDSGSGDGSGELEGVSIAVGTKDFTENILLGEMLALAMENEGADVDNQVNLGGTVVVVLHDLNLAARYCDDLVLLGGGGVAASGPVEDVLVPDLLEPVYGIGVRRLDLDGELHLLFGPHPRGTARP